MRKAGLEESQSGFRIGGLNINNLRYADDTTLIADTKEGLVELLSAVKQESEKYGLHLNLKKTKVMTTGMMDVFRVGNAVVEQIENFTFLGTQIDSRSGCSQEIRRRLAMGRTAMGKLDKIWKSRNVSLATKKRMVQALVFPLVLYGSEAWTISKADRKKIDSFELWCWRRILRIPWTMKVTNKNVIVRVKPEMTLEAMMVKLRLTYLGHVMRRESSMEQNIMLGKTEGRRKKGQPRTQVDGQCTGNNGDVSKTVEGQFKEKGNVEAPSY